MDILAVGIGGALGAVLRYSISLFIPYDGGFPLATWLANCIGCFSLSFLLGGTFLQNQPKIKLALSTGLLGSFTTFSTFSAESLQLIQAAHYITAGIYITSTIGIGFTCSWVGYTFAKGSDCP